jgi:hypothetical protein
MLLVVDGGSEADARRMIRQDRQAWGGRPAGFLLPLIEFD